MQRRLSRRALIVLQLFNGVSGLVGGIGLLSDTTGAALGMEVSWLESTPFLSYLVPGVVLLTVVGLMHLAGAAVTLRGGRTAAWGGMALGTFLCLWIVAQVTWIGYQSLLQPLYFLTGALEMGFGVALRNDRR